MGKPLGDADLDQLFRTARTRRGWTEEATPEVLIRATYDLLKMAPTASNICPGRFMFVRSAEAKARLSRISTRATASRRKPPHGPPSSPTISISSTSSAS